MPLWASRRASSGRVAHSGGPQDGHRAVARRSTAGAVTARLPEVVFHRARLLPRGTPCSSGATPLATAAVTLPMTPMMSRPRPSAAPGPSGPPSAGIATASPASTGNVVQEDPRGWPTPACRSGSQFKDPSNAPSWALWVTSHGTGVSTRSSRHADPGATPCSGSDMFPVHPEGDRRSCLRPAARVDQMGRADDPPASTGSSAGKPANPCTVRVRGCRGPSTTAGTTMASRPSVTAHRERVTTPQHTQKLGR